MLDDNFLSLPSVSHLKRLASAYSLETDLSEATTAYLTERFNSLSEREKFVSLILDEVTIFGMFLA